MRFFVTVALFALAFATSAVAEDHKRDIRGFYVGMSRPQFEAHLKTIDCKAAKDVRGDIECSGPAPEAQKYLRYGGETYVFSLTGSLEPNVLQTVVFNFHSALTAAEMIDQVTAQFDAKPEKYENLIFNPDPRALADADLRSFGHDQFDNMWLAQWLLHDETNTILTLRGAFGSLRGQYSLTISSDQLRKLDNETAARNREMDLRQRLGNNPKF